MMIPEEAEVLRIYINDDDRSGRRPLYEAIIAKARELGLAGASAFRGEAGFGGHRRIHDAMSEYAFVGAPVVVEVIDAPERIAALVSELAKMVGAGTVTVDRALMFRTAPD